MRRGVIGIIPDPTFELDNEKASTKIKLKDSLSKKLKRNYIYLSFRSFFITLNFLTIS